MKTLFLWFLSYGVLLVDGNTLLLELTNGKITYSLNGVVLPLGKLLDSTTGIVGKDTENPMITIFDSKIGVDVVLNAKGIFNKIGFRNVRFFLLSRATEKISEVSLGIPIPFTPNPK